MSKQKSNAFNIFDMSKIRESGVVQRRGTLESEGQRVRLCKFSVPEKNKLIINKQRKRIKTAKIKLTSNLNRIFKKFI